MKRLLALFCLALLASSTDALTLRPDAPKQYIVKEGDSLWEIAEKFLVKPSEWSQLLPINPSISDPNVIYPGAVLVLNTDKNHPYLMMIRRGTRKLSPRAHRDTAYRRIPPIPVYLIRPFINQSQVYSEDVLSTAPYVIGFSGEHLMGGDGTHIYVKGLQGGMDQSFGIFRDNGRFYDAKRRIILGYDARFIASAKMVNPMDPSTLIIDHAIQPVIPGDRLLPLPAEFNAMNFYPHPPHNPVIASILHVYEGIEQVGAHQVVVLDQGMDEGVTRGDVLIIAHDGSFVLDPVYNDQYIKLPDEQVGQLMVFRTFQHVSYALIMDAIRPITVGDFAHG